MGMGTAESAYILLVRFLKEENQVHQCTSEGTSPSRITGSELDWGMSKK